MFADDEVMRPAEQHRIERLIGAPVLQQAVDMDTQLVGEDMIADDRLVERDRPRGRGGDDGCYIAQFASAPFRFCGRKAA